MRRVTFEGCAGWLHAATGNLENTGVVLCAPHGHEAMWSHRAWRHLANDLAAAGVPVLRFDFRGTGDSADPDLSNGGPDPLGVAQADIEAACHVLRTEAHVDHVVLCGLRLGASLAALAAPRVPYVSGVVMLAPVVDGRLYLREMRALHAGWRNSAIPELDVPATPAGDQDVLSFRMPAATVAAIQAMRLDTPVPAPRVLLLDAWPDPASPIAELAGKTREAGAEVEVDAFAEYPEMMRSAEFADVPARAWLRVIDWVKAGAAGQSRISVQSSAQNPAQAAIAHEPTGDLLAGKGMHGIVEQPVWIDGARLFGVLCMPAACGMRERRASTAVIFPNTGGNHHVGDGRLFVDVSRRLARQGIASLRLDVSAIGDSPGAARTMNLQSIYARTPQRDVSSAVDWIKMRGFRYIVLAGICSGAFLSLHAALENAEVTGLMLVNLVKFRWDAADDAAATDHLRSARVYLAAACKWENWRRLLRGELGARRLLTAMVRRVRQRLRERAEVAGAPGITDDTRQTVPDFASAAVRELDRRGVRTMFLYGASDVGLHEARLGLGKRLEALEGLRNIELRTVPLLDHSLFLTASRATFADQLFTHLGRMSGAATSFTAVAPRVTPALSPLRPARRPAHGVAAGDASDGKPARSKPRRERTS